MEKPPEKELNDKGASVTGPEERKITNHDDVHNYDDLYDAIGNFGHWQRVIFVLISLGDIHAAMAVLLPVYTGAVPQWTCTRFGEGVSAINVSNYTAEDQCNLNGSKCTQFAFSTEFTSIVSQWELVCDSDYVSDLITTIQMVGLIGGAAIFGQLSDLIGRKKTYFLTFTIMIGAGFISSFSNSWELYIFLRGLMGLGFGGVMVVACVYPIEFVGKAWRVCCGTIGFWAVGTMVLSPLAYFIRDWRHLTIASSISGVLFYLTWPWIPESPRWLMEKGRLEEAADIIANIARKNNRPPPDITVLKRIAEANHIEEQEHKKYTYLDLFRVRKYAKYTIILFFAWFTVFLMYYEISFNVKNLSGDRYLNMLYSGLVDLVAMLSVIIILNFFGRRRGFCLYLLVSIAVLIIILVIYLTGNEKELSDVITGCAMVGKSTALSGTYSAQLLSAELFPTVVRNLGVGTGSIAGRIGGVVAPQLVYLGTVNVMIPYIVCSVLSIILLPILFLLPETKGRRLEDQFEITKPCSPTTSGHVNNSLDTKL